MALFEVTGWSMPAAPSRESMRHVSKKRKISESLDQIGGPLKREDWAKDESKSSTKKHKRIGQSSSEQGSAPTLPFSPRVKKGGKQKPRTPSESLTALQNSMKKRLDGARFRLINEKLYLSDSHDTRRMMQDDPKVFEEYCQRKYHVGFRHQVLSWPTNPADHYISKFSSYPQKTILADFGCGDAALAKRLLSKGIPVISFDLVSDNQFVVEADICAKVPLPGSEGSPTESSSGEGQIIDVVVCALSLMGTNWLNCLREAWRVLKAGGQLHIAEVTSRFTDIEQFVSMIGSVGFRLKSKDDSNTHFVLFEFTKVPRRAKSEKEWTKLISRGSTVLTPCIYKRR